MDRANRHVRSFPRSSRRLWRTAPFDLGNLDAIRDFTYVDDTVNGFICAAAADAVEGRTFNLGTGTEISIGHLAETIIRKVGSEAKIEVDRNRLRPQKSEVLRLISDNSLAREQLGWLPSSEPGRWVG